MSKLVVRKMFLYTPAEGARSSSVPFNNQLKLNLPAFHVFHIMTKFDGQHLWSMKRIGMKLILQNIGP